MTTIGGVFVLSCAVLVAMLLRAAIRDPGRVDSFLLFAAGGRDADIAERWRYWGRGLFFLWAVTLVISLTIGGFSLIV